MTDPVRTTDAPVCGDGAAHRTVGRWRLIERMGAGAFGEIWHAVRDDGAPAAVKLLSEPPGIELRTLAGVCHPAIPRLIDAATEAPWFIAMSVAPGTPLDHRAAGPPIRCDELLDGICALFDALAAVHAAGLQHGDIKPENILWQSASPPTVSLVDFGLSHGAGGTLAWAAPEHLGDAPVTASADVYSLGLVAWQALVGEVPHAELSAQEALARRAQAAPQVPPGSRGPAWVHRLLEQLLAPTADLRPTAGAVVDRLRAHGIQPPEVDGALLLRRASTAKVSRGAVDIATRTWVQRGGQLVVVGPQGSGRSRVVQSVALELAASGTPSIRLLPLDGPWSSVQAALANNGSSLPEAPDDPTRVEWCVDVLEAAGRHVLVHDYHALDRWSRTVVDRLADGELSLLVTGRNRPRWARSAVGLEPLNRDQIGELLAALLGEGGDQPATRRAVWTASRGLVGDAVRYIIACVEDGALVRSGSTWVLDDARAAQISAVVRQTELRPPESGTRARAVLSVLAHVRRALGVGQLSELLAASREEVDAAIQELALTGLALVDGQQVVLRPALGDRLRALEVDQGLLDHTLAWFSESVPTDVVTLAWLSIAAENVDQIAIYGHDAVRRLIPCNPSEAMRLADALWARLQTARTLEVRLEALVAAGHVKDARSLGQAHIEPLARDAGSPGALVASMVTMAELATNHGGRPDDAIEWCTRARQLVDPSIRPPARLVLSEAHAHSLLGEHGTAASLSEVIASRPAPRDASELRAWLRARTIYAQSIHQNGDLRSALEVLEAVPADLGHGLSERAVLSAALGRLLWFAGRYGDADRAMTDAGRADAGLGMLDRARLLNNLGAVRHHSGDRQGAVAAWEQALVLFNRVESGVEAIRTQANLCVGYKELGRWERSRQTGEAAWAGAQSLGTTDLMCHAALNLGELHLCLGQLVDAERRIRQAAELAQSNAMEREDIEARLRLVELDVLRKRPAAQLDA